MSHTHLSFSMARTALADRILIPKFYDPDLQKAADLARDSGFTLRPLGEVLLDGDAGSHLGQWIPREEYGGGDIPYVRTTDISNWRIRPDFKKGVGTHVLDRVTLRQDVRADDLLMVAHGSYLIGTVAIVPAAETRMVLSDHVFRLRVDPKSKVHPYFLLAALSTAFVRRQVRARQFSADIIDKIGDRHLGLLVPIPNDAGVVARTVERVRGIVTEQTDLRARMASAANTDLRILPERAGSRYAFSVRRRDLRERILIPKYYDPLLEADLARTVKEGSHPWVPLGDLVSKGMLSAQTGIEVGKMAYGTGDIPFIRTSDLVDWEIRRDVTQGVGEAVYERHKARAAVAENDILLVRDGTYLVGASALAGKHDLPALFCGGIFRLRSLDPERLSPFALLAFLNLPIVRRQMRARQFTRDVIDTLGWRLLEVLVPSPSSRQTRELGEQVAGLMERKARVQKETDEAIAPLEPPTLPILRGRPGWSMR
ncbi:MAG: hypothetical protein L6R43_04545 [Planctomycetes bacterium]|nr:hypothetical protein [Planctomycetota bacterium]